MPRFEIKQENYDLPPTAEQRKLLAWCQIMLPPTRIQAHLKIVAHKKTPAGKVQIKAWQLNRRNERRNHAESRPDGDAQRATGLADGAHR